MKMDYDDGDPYSCIAAGYAEQEARKWTPERLAKLKMDLERCYGKPAEELKRLLAMDKSRVIMALREIHAGSQSEEIRRWADEQLSLLGIALRDTPKNP